METPALVPLPEQEITMKLRGPRVWPAILALYVLGAIIPECVMTFNTAPRSFLFNPTTFFFLTAFYGSANLLIRELVRRRPRSLASLLVLGIAFGCVNEGMIAGTWYTVVPTGYILMGGIDWGWAVSLTAFHTLYSVILPIFLVEALFPTLARVSWLRRRGIIGFSVLLAFTVAFTFLLPTYRLERVLVFSAVIVLISIAVSLPVSIQQRRLDTRAVPGLGRLRLAGFAGTLLFFGAIIFLPALLAHILFPAHRVLTQLGIILGVLIFCACLLLIVRRWGRRRVWGHRQSLALITGALLPTILLSLLLPSAWLAAQPAATLPCLALLLWAAYRKRRSETLKNG